MTSESNNNTDENDTTTTNDTNHDNDNNPPPSPSLSPSPPQSPPQSQSSFRNKEHQLKMKLKKQAKKQAKEERIQKRQEKNLTHDPNSTFYGKHKWLGGAVDPKTGIIYGIPSHSYQIISITPSSSLDGEDSKGTIHTIPLPNEYQEGHFKWLRGLIYDGYLYGIPAWNVKGILKVALSTGSGSGSGTSRVKVLPLPREPCYYRTYGNNNNDGNNSGEKDDENKKHNTNEKKRHIKHSNIDRGRWMWHGGTVGITKSSNQKNTANGSSEDDAAQLSTTETRAAIYCVPSNAQHVLKVSLDGSDKVEEIGPSLSEGQNKWYGGILGADGCVYGMPYTATGVLRINPKNDSVQVLGNYPAGGYKWHGGLIAHSTGVIYAFPAHSNEVLCVDSNSKDDDTNGEEEGDQSWRVSTIPIQRHEHDTDPHDLQYKWLGGSYGADGCIYGMPSDATTILRIDPIKNVATTFGTVSSTINKWQGGVLSKVDDCVYAVPADMDCVLRIDTNPDTPLKIDLIGDGFQDIDDKWQGGFVGSDDKIYAIPENINNVMVITPGNNPQVEMLT